MVKAYLRYVQQDIVGGLVGNQSNIQICTIKYEDGTVKGVYIVSACNEVINFTNIHTGEVHHKLYDEEALHGQVRQLKVSSNLLAIGYNDGTIQIYDLNLQEGKLEQVHSFSFHRSAITSIVFFADNT